MVIVLQKIVKIIQNLIIQCPFATFTGALKPNCKLCHVPHFLVLLGTFALTVGLPGSITKGNLTGWLPNQKKKIKAVCDMKWNRI